MQQQKDGERREGLVRFAEAVSRSPSPVEALDPPGYHFLHKEAPREEVQRSSELRTRHHHGFLQRGSGTGGGAGASAPIQRGHRWYDDVVSVSGELKHGKSEKESEQSDDFKTRALQLWEEKKRRALQEVRLSKKKQQTEAIEITPTKTSEQSHGSVDVDALFNMLSQGKDVIRRSDWDAAFAKATGNCEAENGHALPSTVVEIQGRKSHTTESRGKPVKQQATEFWNTLLRQAEIPPRSPKHTNSPIANQVGEALAGLGAEEMQQFLAKRACLLAKSRTSWQG